MSTDKSKPNKPVKEFSDGAIKVAVWVRHEVAECDCLT